MDEWKVGERFRWFDQTWQIIRKRAKSKEFDCGQPFADAFGKEALISHKVFHLRDMVHARKIQ